MHTAGASGKLNNGHKLRNSFSIFINAVIYLTYFLAPTICSFAYAASIYECFDDGKGSLVADWNVTVGDCERVPVNASTWDIGWVGPDGTRWMLTSVDEEYQKITTLSWSMVIGYGFVTPLLYLLILVSYRHDLLAGDDTIEQRREEDALLDALGSLYEGFQPEYYYWEVYNCIRKQAFVGAIGLVVKPQGSERHLLAAIVVAVLCVVIQALAMPFGDHRAINKPCRSNNILALCADVSLLFFLGGLFVLKLKVELSALSITLGLLLSILSATVVATALVVLDVATASKVAKKAQSIGRRATMAVMNGRASMAGTSGTRHPRRKSRRNRSVRREEEDESSEEASSRDDYIFRPYPETEENQSVRFFFGVFDDLTEFDVVGFSKECYEDMGGNQIEYSNLKLSLHVVRRWQYYFWKVALPMLFCTATALLVPLPL